MYIVSIGASEIDDSCISYAVNVEDVQSCTAPGTSLLCQAFLLNYTGTYIIYVHTLW